MRKAWLFLVPEQVYGIVLLALFAPAFYAELLLTRHELVAGSLLLLTWAAADGWLLAYVHRKRWARLAVSVPATLLVLLVALWIMSQ